MQFLHFKRHDYFEAKVSQRYNFKAKLPLVLHPSQQRPNPLGSISKEQDHKGSNPVNNEDSSAPYSEALVTAPALLISLDTDSEDDGDWPAQNSVTEPFIAASSKKGERQLPQLFELTTAEEEGQTLTPLFDTTSSGMIETLSKDQVTLSFLDIGIQEQACLALFPHYPLSVDNPITPKDLPKNPLPLPPLHARSNWNQTLAIVPRPVSRSGTAKDALCSTLLSGEAKYGTAQIAAVLESCNPSCTGLWSSNSVLSLERSLPNTKGDLSFVQFLGDKFLLQVTATMAGTPHLPNLIEPFPATHPEYQLNEITVTNIEEIKDEAPVPIEGSSAIEAIDIPLDVPELHQMESTNTVNMEEQDQAEGPTTEPIGSGVKDTVLSVSSQTSQTCPIEPPDIADEGDEDALIFEDLQFIQQAHVDCTTEEMDAAGDVYKYLAMVDSLPPFEQFRIEDVPTELQTCPPAAVSAPRQSLKIVAKRASAHSLDEFMLAMTGEIQEKTTSSLWSGRVALEIPKSHNIPDFMGIMIEKLIPHNTLLVLPTSIPLFPLLATIIYNYLQCARTTVLWITHTEERALAAETFHQTYFNDQHDHYIVSTVQKLSKWSGEDSILLLATPHSAEIHLPVLRQGLPPISLLIFDGIDHRHERKLTKAKLILKSLQGFKPKILLTSPFPAASSQEFTNIVSLFSLEQLMCRTLHDADVSACFSIQSFAVPCSEQVRSLLAEMNRESVALCNHLIECGSLPPSTTVDIAMEEIKCYIAKTNPQVLKLCNNTEELALSRKMLVLFYVLRSVSECLFHEGICASLSLYQRMRKSDNFGPLLEELNLLDEKLSQLQAESEAGLLFDHHGFAQLKILLGSIQHKPVLILVRSRSVAYSIIENLQPTARLRMCHKQAVSDCNADDADCFVCLAESASSNSPWHMFSSIIEYALPHSTEWQPPSLTDLILANKISLYYVTIVDPRTALREQDIDAIQAVWVNVVRGHIEECYKKIDYSDTISTKLLVQFGLPENLLMGLSLEDGVCTEVEEMAPITIIGNEQALQAQELITSLEKVASINVLERTFDYANFLLDEKTGVVIFPSSFLRKTTLREDMLDNIAARLTRCWFIFVVREHKGPKEMEMLAAIQRELTYLKLHFAQTDLEYIPRISFGDEETALFIRQAADQVRQGNKLKLHKLQNETMHEMFLSSFPGMTPYTAQLILAQCSLPSFCMMSHEERVTTFPSIPARFLQAFEEGAC